MESDQAYFARRAAAEWFAVAAAKCDRSRIVHAELARRYADLANVSTSVIRLAHAQTSRSDRACLVPAGNIAPIEAHVGI